MIIRTNTRPAGRLLGFPLRGFGLFSSLLLSFASALFTFCSPPWWPSSPCSSGEPPAITSITPTATSRRLPPRPHRSGHCPSVLPRNLDPRQNPQVEIPMPVLTISSEALQSALARCAPAASRLVHRPRSRRSPIFPAPPVPIPPTISTFSSASSKPAAPCTRTSPTSPIAMSSPASTPSRPRRRRRQLHEIMRRYSVSVEDFLARFLAPYQKRWALDYASYRPRRSTAATSRPPPQRPSPHRRLPHTPHPRLAHSPLLPQHSSRSHPRLGGRRALSPCGRQLHPPTAPSALRFIARSRRQIPGPGHRPRRPRPPVETHSIRRVHDAAPQCHERDSVFQGVCSREYFQFAPGSSWMVYTETVPHAVLAGQYALEQTFLVTPPPWSPPNPLPSASSKKWPALPSPDPAPGMN